jgi:hypothetical protein
MDLADQLSKAVLAARRGDLESLEIELARIRSLGESVVGLGARLRAMARSARAHPSFNARPKAEAV